MNYKICAATMSRNFSGFEQSAFEHGEKYFFLYKTYKKITKDLELDFSGLHPFHCSVFKFITLIAVSTTARYSPTAVFSSEQCFVKKSK